VEVSGKRPWVRWWPFVLLLLLGGGRWMLAGAWPQTDSSLDSQAAGCACAALGCAAVLLGFRRDKARWSQVSFAAAGGALMLCGPATAELLQAGRVESSGVMIALALTPVVVALAGRTDAVAGRLWPGLAAVAGLLLVLAQPSLGDARSDVALALTPVLTGCGAALLGPERSASAWRMPAALLGAAVVFALGWGANAWLAGGVVAPSLPATACDGVLALLSLLVLVRLGAVRWSAQFALLPLLVLVQGIGILRPSLTLRWATGLLLLAVAGVYLLLPQEDDAETTVVPR
jgi:drug/metabolite transporter (DMT)-like permease